MHGQCRAISGPFTPVIRGYSRSLADPQIRRAWVTTGQAVVSGPDGLSRRVYQVMVATSASWSKPGGNRNGVNLPLFITPICRPLGASSRVPLA
jgi:hypothetical protein